MKIFLDKTLKINKIIFYFSVISILFFYFFVEIKFPFTKYAFARPWTFLIFIFLAILYKDYLKEILKKYKLPILLFIIFFFINILSLILNFQGTKHLEGFGHIFITSLIFPICLLLFYERENFNEFLKIIYALSVILFLFNIFFLFNPNLYQKLYAHAQSYPRLGSLFQHPISLGVFSVIVYLILVTNFKNFINKFFYYCLVLVNLLNLLISGGKISFILWIILSGVALYYIFLRTKDYKNLILHIIILIFISMLFYHLWLSPQNIILFKISYITTKDPEFSEWLKDFYTAKTYKETSVNRRIEIWNKALEYLSSNKIKLIFGYGPYAFGKILEKDYKHTHSLFLEFLISYGLIGFAFLFIVIFLIYKKLLKAKSFILNTIFSYYLLHSFFDVLFWGGVLDLIFFTFLTYLIYNPQNG